MFDVARTARAAGGGRDRDDGRLRSAHLVRRPRPELDSHRTREYNDFAAELAREHPGRLAALGSVTPWRGDDHVREAERAVTRARARRPRAPDERRAAATSTASRTSFWELVTGLDVPLFVHPGGTVVGQELMTMYRLGEVCGRPLDTTVTLARYILTGVLERIPSIRLLCAHAGGAICTICRPARLRPRAARATRRSGRGARSSCPSRPSAYVARLYLDTVTYGTAASASRARARRSRASRLRLGPPARPVPARALARPRPARSVSRPARRRRCSAATRERLFCARMSDAAASGSAADAVGSRVELTAERRSGERSTALVRATGRSPTRCAHTGSRARTSAASTASAARARSSSTASLCARASCSRSRPPGRRVDTVESLGTPGEPPSGAAGVPATRARSSAASARPASSCSPPGSREREPDADDARIRDVLSSNLCRCTGYGSIVDAVARAAA